MVEKIINKLDDLSSTISTTTSTNNGIDFCGILGIVFIVLKLVHVINWSWWWVLSPLWIPTAFAIAVFVIIFVIVLIAKLIDRR